MDKVNIKLCCYNGVQDPILQQLYELDFHILFIMQKSIELASLSVSQDSITLCRMWENDAKT